MPNKRLSRVPALPRAVVATLKLHNVVSCRDYFNTSVLELMGILNYSFSQLQMITALVSAAAAPEAQTALSLYKEKEEGVCGPLKTSLHKLDAALRGGLSAGTVTEVVGPPGCGKTQLCIMLSVVAALPRPLGGRASRVAYIDTEAAFTAERLVEMAKARHVDHFSSLENLVDLAARVLVFQELTCDAFLKRLELLEETLASHGVGLIVVDSIASLVRKEFDTSSGRGVAYRAALLASQAARLKYLAEAYRVPVVVTNQITTHMSHDDRSTSDWTHEEAAASAGSSGVVTAALGTSWAHCVNTRLLLDYAHGTKRELMVSKSPVCGQERFVVSIEDKGLVLDWLATAEVEPGSSVGLGAESLRPCAAAIRP